MFMSCNRVFLAFGCFLITHASAEEDQIARLPSKISPVNGVAGSFGMSRASKYSGEQLAKCLEDVRRGALNVSEASRKYKIPRSTIISKITGARPEKLCRRGPKAVLGEECERKIIEWLLQQARKGFPIRKCGLLFTVKKIVEKWPKKEREQLPFKKNTPGRKWFQSFLSRNPIITQKKAEYLSASRKKISESRIRKWFQDVKELLGDDFEVMNDPNRIFNMDETSFHLTPTGDIVLSEKGKPVYDVSKNSDKDNITVSIGVSATGIQTPTLVVYKYVRLPSGPKRAAPKGWGVGCTDSGWMISKAFYEYFANAFIPWLKREKIQLPVIVFFDGHKSHLSLPLSELCRENGVILVCLVAQATHILQPLDVAFIKALKTYWKKAVHLFKLIEGRDLEKDEVPKLVQKILDENDFKLTSKNGFRKCGLFPFDADAVDYKKCTQDDEEKVESASTGDAQSVPSNFMNYFESKIEKEILEDFQKKYSGGMRNWCGDPENAELFKIWSSLIEDDLSYSSLTIDKTVIHNHDNEVSSNLSNNAPFQVSNLDDDFNDVLINDPELSAAWNEIIVYQDDGIPPQHVEIAETSVTWSSFKNIPIASTPESNEENLSIDGSEKSLVGLSEKENSSKLEEAISCELEKENSNGIQQEVFALEKENSPTGLFENKNSPVFENKIPGSLEKENSSGIYCEKLTAREEPRCALSDVTNLSSSTPLSNRKISNEAGMKATKLRLVDEILDSVRVFPEKSTTAKKRVFRKRVMPCVMTSDTWVELEEAHQREKDAAFQEKEERRLKRANKPKGKGQKKKEDHISDSEDSDAWFCEEERHMREIIEEEDQRSKQKSTGSSKKQRKKQKRSKNQLSDSESDVDEGRVSEKVLKKQKKNIEIGSAPNEQLASQPVLKRVSPQVATASADPVEYLVDDWVVARFPLYQKDGFMKFISQITEKRQAGEITYLVNCLRPKDTKSFKGYIYCYPDVPDNETYINKSDILYKVNSPQKWQRALKFDKHCNDL